MLSFASDHNSHRITVICKNNTRNERLVKRNSFVHNTNIHSFHNKQTRAHPSPCLPQHPRCLLCVHILRFLSMVQILSTCNHVEVHNATLKNNNKCTIHTYCNYNYCPDHVRLGNSNVNIISIIIP